MLAKLLMVNIMHDERPDPIVLKDLTPSFFNGKKDDLSSNKAVIKNEIILNHRVVEVRPRLM
ncbi:MAG: hypothetical protein BMS9Abin31_0419 [Gammaproteobacteria bacterium]|nr:MAG: hypothetical protein BMS9Abin31_0419 [Gammaproteobacteria bacterium]